MPILENKKYSPMYVPIFRKILSYLFTTGSLRPTELLAKMPEEAKSSYYNAMRKLEDEGLITARVKLNKLSVYSLTDKGMCAVNGYLESNSIDVIGTILQYDYDDLLYRLLIIDVKKRTDIKVADVLYDALVKKNYELFIKKMNEDLKLLTKSF